MPQQKAKVKQVAAHSMAGRKDKRRNQAEVLRNYAKLGDLTLSAKLAGISESTLLNYKHDKHFLEELQAIKPAIETAAINKVVEIMERGQDREALVAAQRLLEWTRPTEWDAGVRREQVRQAGQVDAMRALADAIYNRFGSGSLPADPLARIEASTPSQPADEPIDAEHVDVTDADIID